VNNHYCSTISQSNTRLYMDLY